MNFPEVLGEPLVELVVSEDPLCPPERYSLTVRRTTNGYEYIESQPECDKGQVALISREPLSNCQLVELLNRQSWFRSDITLEMLEDTQLASPDDWVCGGSHPLLECYTEVEEVADAFKCWVRSRCVELMRQRTHKSD
jgi:hypothetical protein